MAERRAIAKRNRAVGGIVAAAVALSGWGILKASGSIVIAAGFGGTVICVAALLLLFRQLYPSSSDENAQATSTFNSASVTFSVISEYTSATNEHCKKYKVDNAIYLACYNSNWYPLRVFDNDR